MAMTLFLGIDLGTSYFKVGLFDRSGALRGLGRIPVEKDSPGSQRVELPVDRFWELLRRGLGEALNQAQASPADIAGISYSSQANTFVLLDSEEKPLTPFILWTDTRGDPVPGRMSDFARTEAFRRTAGFEGIAGGWAVAKCAWFRRVQPELWRQVRRVMTISDYLTFSLTSELKGDAGTAAFLGLYDLTTKAWGKKALEAFEIPEAYLSLPLAPGSKIGPTSARATLLLGLPPGVPFAVGGLDHQLAGLGAGIGRFANTSISIGTVLAAMNLVERPDPCSGCYHGEHFERRGFYRLAFDSRGASQLEDYQRRYASGLTLEQLVDLAVGTQFTVKDAKRSAPGMIHVEHGLAVLRLLEDLAARQADLVQRVNGQVALSGLVATGGGARSPLCLQLMANAIGVPVIAPDCAEPACLGAAILAAVCSGVFASVSEAARSMVHESHTYHPQRDGDA